MLLIISTILFPILVGTIMLLLLKEERLGYSVLCRISGVTLVLEFILVMYCLIVTPKAVSGYEILNINDALVISFGIDSIGRMFAAVSALTWTLIGFFSFEYLKKEQHRGRFLGMYILVFGILMGLCFAANLITYYAFYEFLTLSTFALVLHKQSREALMAGLKYMFYSFAGAYMVLFGLYFVYQYSPDPSMSFSLGGILDVARACNEGALRIAQDSAGGGVLSVAMLLMLLGFGVKAGMFPMQAWLPTAHPIAPAPASAGLSAIIVKAGVLGIIRVIYYIFGAKLFSGSYVQTIVLILALITIFMGSMLAYREKLFKKRLAYSTVSQVSYILFGLFIGASSVASLNGGASVTDLLGCGFGDAFDGAMIQVAAHAFIKSALFLCSGVIIYQSGATYVHELKGIGKKMPILLGCYTIASLGLIGIPPFGGFTGKWYLCIGALETELPVFSWLGPVVLLISALLTAGYLLPIAIQGFLPGSDFEQEVKSSSNSDLAEGGKYHAYAVCQEPNAIMLVPIIILTLLSVIVGIWPSLI